MTEFEAKEAADEIVTRLNPNDVAGVNLVKVFATIIKRHYDTATTQYKLELQRANAKCAEQAAAKAREEWHVEQFNKELRKDGCNYGIKRGETWVAVELTKFACQIISAEHNLSLAQARAPLVDRERLDWLEMAHEIRRSKYGWAVLMAFTNYEYDLYPTLREAIDAARRTGTGEKRLPIQMNSL